jgi:NADP-dependent 3-hydroxy acid dehydrogenase YdfG
MAEKTLADRTIIVTGASSGIGEATARLLAQAGAQVVVAARRKERLEALQAKIEAAGGRCVAVPTDAAEPTQLDALFEQAVKAGHGVVNAVIANAGHGLAGSLLTSDQSRWDGMYKLNVLGTAHLLRRAAEHMAPHQAGDIVAVSSIVGVNISPFSAFYGSTKFALGGLMEALRRELAPRHVRVTLVKPGIVATEFQQVAGYDQENFGKAVQKYGKLLVGEDIARAIRFVLEQPPHVCVNDIMVRPVGQDYP